MCDQTDRQTGEFTAQMLSALVYGETDNFERALSSEVRANR